MSQPPSLVKYLVKKDGELNEERMGVKLTPDSDVGDLIQEALKVLDFEGKKASQFRVVAVKEEEKDDGEEDGNWGTPLPNQEELGTSRKGTIFVLCLKPEAAAAGAATTTTAATTTGAGASPETKQQPQQVDAPPQLATATVTAPPPAAAAAGAGGVAGVTAAGAPMCDHYVGGSDPATGRVFFRVDISHAQGKTPVGAKWQKIPGVNWAVQGTVLAQPGVQPLEDKYKAGTPVAIGTNLWVESSADEKTLTFTFDPTAPTHPSSTGKSQVIAQSEGKWKGLCAKFGGTCVTMMVIESKDFGRGKRGRD